MEGGKQLWVVPFDVTVFVISSAVACSPTQPHSSHMHSAATLRWQQYTRYNNSFSIVVVDTPTLAHSHF